MMKVPRLIRKRVHRRILRHLPRTYPASPLPVSVLIPLAVKDIANARLCVEGLRRHLLHPIDSIVVAGQDSELIRAFCAREGLVYINENDALPESVLNFKYFSGGRNMNGWIRQQILKLSVFNYLDAERVLVMDSDTFQIKDLSYFVGPLQVFYTADDYTKNYYDMPPKLLGTIERHPRSFVAHCMMFQRDIMQALERHVTAQCGLGLTDAILARVRPEIHFCLSEFEIYGNYMHNFAKDRFTTRYWYNEHMRTAIPATLAELEARYRGYNWVSAHTYTPQNAQPASIQGGR